MRDFVVEFGVNFQRNLHTVCRNRQKETRSRLSRLVVDVLGGWNPDSLARETKTSNETAQAHRNLRRVVSIKCASNKYKKANTRYRTKRIKNTVRSKQSFR